MTWQAVIFGPDDTPWEGGTFKLLLEFTEDYPNKAPQVRFHTKMFHPNIYNDGQICLGTLHAVAVEQRFPSDHDCRSLAVLTCDAERRLVSRYSTEPMVADLRRLCDPHVNPVTPVRPQPCVAGELGGLASLSREQTGVQPPGQRDRGAELELRGR